MAEVHAKKKALQREHPGLFDEVLPSQFFHSSRLTMILQEFIRQGGDGGDFQGIIEALAAYASTCGKAFVAEDEFDLSDILLFLRSRFRHETHERLQRGGKVVRVLTLQSETEKTLARAALQEFGDRLKLSEEDRFALKGSLENKLAQLAEWGVQPLAIACSRQIAGKLNIFLREFGQILPLLTEEDVFQKTRLRVLGSW
jgi:flagellar biosynthesis component FlhA